MYIGCSTASYCCAIGAITSAREPVCLQPQSVPVLSRTTCLACLSSRLILLTMKEPLAHILLWLARHILSRQHRLAFDNIGSARVQTRSVCLQEISPVTHVLPERHILDAFDLFDLELGPVQTVHEEGLDLVYHMRHMLMTLAMHILIIVRHTVHTAVFEYLPRFVPSDR